MDIRFKVYTLILDSGLYLAIGFWFLPGYWILGLYLDFRFLVFFLNIGILVSTWILDSWFLPEY